MVFYCRERSTKRYKDHKVPIVWSTDHPGRSNLVLPVRAFCKVCFCTCLMRSEQVCCGFSVAFEMGCFINFHYRLDCMAEPGTRMPGSGWKTQMSWCASIIYYDNNLWSVAHYCYECFFAALEQFFTLLEQCVICSALLKSWLCVLLWSLLDRSDCRHFLCGNGKHNSSPQSDVDLCLIQVNKINLGCSSNLLSAIPGNAARALTRKLTPVDILFHWILWGIQSKLKAKRLTFAKGNQQNMDECPCKSCWKPCASDHGVESVSPISPNVPFTEHNNKIIEDGIKHDRSWLNTLASDEVYESVRYIFASLSPNPQGSIRWNGAVFARNYHRRM